MHAHMYVCIRKKPPLRSSGGVRLRVDFRVTAEGYVRAGPQHTATLAMPQPQPTSPPVHSTYEATSPMPSFEPVRHTTRGAPRPQHGRQG